MCRPKPAMDPECERPRNYDEYVSGDKSWEELGIRIKWTDPKAPGSGMLEMMKPIRLRLCVEVQCASPVHADEITAWVWTPIVTESNPCGIWKEVSMTPCPMCTQCDSGTICYIFQAIILPENEENSRITYNVKWRNKLIWCNVFQKDAVVEPVHTDCPRTRYSKKCVDSLRTVQAIKEELDKCDAHDAPVGVVLLTRYPDEVKLVSYEHGCKYVQRTCPHDPRIVQTVMALINDPA